MTTTMLTVMAAHLHVRLKVQCFPCACIITLCHIFNNIFAAVAGCGGKVDAGEECDDDNNADGDGCSSACTIEGSVFSLCMHYHFVPHLSTISCSCCSMWWWQK